MKIVFISTSTYPSDQGLRTVSSCLKKEGYEVKLIFLPMEEDYTLKYSKDVLEKVKEICKDAFIIGVSAYASTSPRAIQVIEYLKPLGKMMLWGGPHATILPERCIPYVDAVCRGEGEEAVVEFVNAVRDKKNYTQIANFWVKKEGKIIKNPVRCLNEGLDHLPPMDYDLEDHYLLENNKLIKFQERHLNGYIFFMTSRGCPNACTYCSNHLYRQLYMKKGKLVRGYSVDYVIDEMKRLKNKFPSIAVFDVRDETLLIRPLEDIKRFSKRYKEEVGIRFKCLADPPTTNEEKLKYLVDAGLTDIIIGIQSGSDRMNLQVYKRYIKREQVVKAAKIINKFKGKLFVMYDMITTNPYETKEDVLESINIMRELPKPYFLSVNNLVFFLGTPLYEQAIKDGVVRSKKDSAFDLNYWDRWKHIRLKKKNAYLNLVLNLMRGPCTERRYSMIPAFVLKFLVKPKVVDWNLRNKGPTYVVGSMVGMFDFVREKVAKPIYRNALPTSLKVWYDKVRYKV